MIGSGDCLIREGRLPDGVWLCQAYLAGLTCSVMCLKICSGQPNLGLSAIYKRESSVIAQSVGQACGRLHTPGYPAGCEMIMQ